MQQDRPSQLSRHEERVAAVTLQGVTKVFDGQVKALENVDLTIPEGAFMALTGPSGCGKTTVLRLVAGLVDPTSGVVAIDGSSPHNADQIACCFQDPRLLPWRSIQRNVELPLELMGQSPSERRDRALEALERVGLADFSKSLPRQLSGGMRMRVSLARALVVRPKILLLDEPCGALDEVTREQLDDELIRLWHEDRMTVLLVTHSIWEAVYLAGRVAVMASSPGRIVSMVDVDLGQRTPDTRTSAQFTEYVREIREALRQETVT